MRVDTYEICDTTMKNFYLYKFMKVHFREQSTFAGYNAKSPSDIKDFAMLHDQRFLSGNIFIV